MNTTTARPRILTLNEMVGDHIAPDDEGGAWLVKHGITTLAVASNRKTAEAILYAKADESGDDPAWYGIEVWHIFDSEDEYLEEGE